MSITRMHGERGYLMIRPSLDGGNVHVRLWEPGQYEDWRVEIDWITPEGDHDPESFRCDTAGEAMRFLRLHLADRDVDPISDLVLDVPPELRRHVRLDELTVGDRLVTGGEVRGLSVTLQGNDVPPGGRWTVIGDTIRTTSTGRVLSVAPEVLASGARWQIVEVVR